MNIYFATPISKLINPDDGLMDGKQKVILELVYEKIYESFGEKIFFAAKEEKWGALHIDDSDCVLRDVAKMKESDLVIAIFLNEISEGVLVELGWASAMNKTVECIVDSGVAISKLVRGLSSITDFKINRIDFSLHKQELNAEIEKILNNIIKRNKRKNIVLNFFKQWEEHNMSTMVENFDTNIELVHPYFDKIVTGKQDVLSSLKKINLDFAGKINIVLYRNLNNSNVEIKFNEGNYDIADKLSQDIVTNFEFKNNKIVKIHFVGVELSMNGYENGIKKYFHNLKSDEEVICELIYSWSEKNLEKFYSLFACNAKIFHPIYINTLSPDMFFILMNSNVNVTSLLKEIVCVEKFEEEKTKYKVVIEEKSKVDNLDISEMIIYITIKNLQILEMKIVGLNY